MAIMDQPGTCPVLGRVSDRPSISPFISAAKAQRTPDRCTTPPCRAAAVPLSRNSLQAVVRFKGNVREPSCGGSVPWPSVEKTFVTIVVVNKTWQIKPDSPPKASLPGSRGTRRRSSCSWSSASHSRPNSTRTPGSSNLAGKRTQRFCGSGEVVVKTQSCRIIGLPL